MNTHDDERIVEEIFSVFDEIDFLQKTKKPTNSEVLAGEKATYPKKKLVLQQYIATIRADHTLELEEVRRDYQELLMSVESKFEGETRHETALRYIKQAEQRPTPPTEVLDNKIN